MLMALKTFCAEANDQFQYFYYVLFSVLSIFTDAILNSSAPPALLWTV